MHASYDCRARLPQVCEQRYARALMRGRYDPKPPSQGDKPASYDSRELRSETAPIGVINLPATIQAIYDPRAIYEPKPPLLRDKPASHDTRDPRSETAFSAR